MKTVTLTSILAVGLLLTPGCGGSDDEEEESSLAESFGDSLLAAAAEAAEEAEQEAAAQPLTLIEHDLASADPQWAGWAADAPADAQVMADGTHGARLAANGLDGWDLSFAPRHRDLAQMREALESGSSEELTTEFTMSDDTHLEWTRTGYGSTSYNFIHNFEVDGQEVSCANNYMMGIRSEARFEQHKEACQTLRRSAAE